MDLDLRDRFVERWRRYFGGRSFRSASTTPTTRSGGSRAAAARTRVPAFPAGARAARAAAAIRCRESGLRGREAILGFHAGTASRIRVLPLLWIPGKLEGERYKQSPGSSGNSCSGRRGLRRLALYRLQALDALEETDTPEVVIFFASPDVLSGLFTLANFDEAEPNGVYCPSRRMGSIVQYPYLERQAVRPRAILGMFEHFGASTRAP